MFLTTYYDGIVAQKSPGSPTMEEARRDHAALQRRRAAALASALMR